MPMQRAPGRRKDPACGTCRKDCRRCDKIRPACARCRSRGLACEGYPPRFEFRGVDPSQWQDRPRIQRQEERDSADAAQPTAPREDAPPPPPPPLPSRASPPRAHEHVANPDVEQRESPSTAIPVETPGGHGGATAEATPNLDYVSEHQVSRPTPTTAPGPNPADFASPAASRLSNSTGLSETFARLDRVELLGYKPLIDHFKHSLIGSITITANELPNPFADHILPLAYQDDGVLHALLGLSACHLYSSAKDQSPECWNTALRHRVAAIRSLGTLLEQEEASQLTPPQEECVLATVLLLVFHDICESGVSSCGAHLTGVSFLCSRVASYGTQRPRSRANIFFVSVLTWLDLLRGFSGAEKLAYPEEVHEYVRDHGNRVFHSFVGCPPALFFRISQVLHAGKAYKAGNLPVEAFRPLLDKAGKFFHYWDPEQETYPTGAPEWTLLAEAFRHACILRVLRFPDSFAIPCTDSSVRRAASAILDICAQMPRNSAYYKRLLFPLFLAGAEMSSPHQVQYIGWCIDEIKRSTGFQYPAMLDMLLQVWEKRQSSDSDIPNIPWMEFTCSEMLQSQHAYLFF